MGGGNPCEIALLPVQIKFFVSNAYKLDQQYKKCSYSYTYINVHIIYECVL